MLSICIPVYNQDITALVDHLSAQMQSLPVPSELVVIDDGSTDATARAASARAAAAHQYVPLPTNVGRARVRNRFLDHAQYDYLLFLDNDVAMVRDDFLASYVAVLPQPTADLVVCGGRVYDATPPPTHYRLRWKYGREREHRPLVVRHRYPNRSFMTNNFVVSKGLLSAVRFEESLTTYGHEDTLFGYQLKRRGLTIRHLDNPVGSGDLETNEDYLRKTAAGVSNLVRIYRAVGQREDFAADIGLLWLYRRLRRRRLADAVRYVLTLSRPVLRGWLLTGTAPLVAFDLYKMSLLLPQMSPTPALSTSQPAGALW